MLQLLKILKIAWKICSASISNKFSKYFFNNLHKKIFSNFSKKKFPQYLPKISSKFSWKFFKFHSRNLTILLEISRITVFYLTVHTHFSKISSKVSLTWSNISQNFSRFSSILEENSEFLRQFYFYFQLSYSLIHVLALLIRLHTSKPRIHLTDVFAETQANMCIRIRQV